MYKKQFIIFQFASNVAMLSLRAHPLRSSYPLLLPLNAYFLYNNEKAGYLRKSSGTTKTNYASNNNTNSKVFFTSFAFFFLFPLFFFICKVSYRKSSFEAAKSKSRAFLRLLSFFFQLLFTFSSDEKSLNL